MDRFRHHLIKIMVDLAFIKDVVNALPRWVSPYN